MRRESLHALEFDRILEAIAGFSHGAPSSGKVLKIRPLSGASEIKEKFALVADVRRLGTDGNPLRLRYFEDISGVLEKARPEDAVLEPKELLAFIPVLSMMQEIPVQLREGPGEKTKTPSLAALASGLTGFPETLAAIERSIGPEGDILDGASPELSYIRGRKRGLESRIRRRLEEIVRDAGVTPFLQDEFISQRSGRWVIPVRMDSKGQVPGVVHDISRSGETAFMEPLEIIGVSNELENLAAQEKAEEIRILKSISGRIRSRPDEIARQYETVIALDVLNSIALFSDGLGAGIPEINGSSTLKIVRGRHPLLVLLKGAGEIVPLDLTLGGQDRVMVITGPNAGGKTIAMKTAGLLTLMALSGIPVPADPSSSFPVSEGMLVDIGDEQSIEADLSTFAAHVENISLIIKSADPKTVVLMDELGTGTDPSQGAALACSVLEDLKQKGALVLATTHLIDIITFVHRTPGMVNASMEFDAKTLTPLYRLKPGEPGESYALEIARRYGMPEAILGRAREMLGTAGLEFHQLVRDLKEKRAGYEDMLSSLDVRGKELERKEKILEQKLSQSEDLKKDALRKAYEEAARIVFDARREVGAIIEEQKRERKTAREALKKLAGAKSEIDTRLKEFRGEPQMPIEEINEGDTVFVPSLGGNVTVAAVDKKNGRVRVRVGNISFEAPVSDILPPKGKGVKAQAGGVAYTPGGEGAAMQLNIAGLRVDDAIPRLERFLNQASLAGLGEVTVVHGIGTGALLKAVREYLAGHPLAAEFRAGTQPEGGAGVTIIKLR
ncbi:MAG: endonuclease MutS2 [Nitrospiraceae bacterium]|nr:endonuclease MutS2 [Nitrospiraceae bacterium]